MISLFRTVVLFFNVSTLGCGYSQSFDAEFTGPILLINYQVEGKPEKTKDRLNLDLLSNGPCILTFEGGASYSGSWYNEFGYVWLKFQQGAPITSGRLKLKGKPGSETGISGTLTSVFNDYVSFYDYKLNLKRIVR